MQNKKFLYLILLYDIRIHMHYDYLLCENKNYYFNLIFEHHYFDIYYYYISTFLKNNSDSDDDDVFIVCIQKRVNNFYISYARVKSLMNFMSQNTKYFQSFQQSPVLKF